MTETSSKSSPFQRAWNIFSAIAAVVGTAGMVDDIANWASFIKIVVQGYEAMVCPVLRPITDAISMPPWFTDYLFVGFMVSSARARPTFNHMREYWIFDVSKYKWFAFWAPHRVATIAMSVLMALLWPLLLITFLPPSILKPEPRAYAFQHQIWRDQFHWLAIYTLVLLGLFIANAGLRALAIALANDL
ncbi:hypothetical protein [Nitrosospira multiformis]|uniref:Uncharacterized protein n=1 Tax=Nitrosospira multiformis TaxID=1231 RepID=A0A1I7IYL6_9PROT|nr:hypothetical protein [Nitrosospira multiformis]SFU78028.1 hypothetical protein SAMN05216417_1333 [Nitrosospira multiformis]